MTSGHVRDLLSPYIDDRVEPEDRERIASHLAGCEACRADLATLQEVVGLLHSVPPVPAPEGLRAAIRSRVAQDRRVPAGRWIARVRGAMVGPLARSWRPLAAAVAVAILGMFVWNFAGPRGTLFEEYRDKAVRVKSRGSVPQSTAPSGSPSQRGNEVTTELNSKGPFQAPGVSGAPPGGFSRSVIRTARLGVEVDRYDAGVRRLLDIAEGAGGFIADSSYGEVDGRPQGELTLRVPAGRFAAAVKDVEALGTVRQRQISAQDVTEEFVDLEARRRNLERHEHQLLSFMDRAAKVTDLMAIEQELARVRGQIEQIAGRLRYLSHNVEMASITVTLSERARTHGLWDAGGTLGKMQRAFTAAVQQLLAVAERVLVLGASLLPIAALALAAWMVFRRTRRASAGA
jgi:Domain of unknown function (DUF4349)/Putative zinc-finger